MTKRSNSSGILYVIIYSPKIQRKFLTKWDVKYCNSPIQFRLSTQLFPYLGPTTGISSSIEVYIRWAGPAACPSLSMGSFKNLWARIWQREKYVKLVGNYAEKWMIQNLCNMSGIHYKLSLKTYFITHINNIFLIKFLFVKCAGITQNIPLVIRGLYEVLASTYTNFSQYKHNLQFVVLIKSYHSRTKLLKVSHLNKYLLSH